MSEVREIALPEVQQQVSNHHHLHEVDLSLASKDLKDLDTVAATAVAGCGSSNATGNKSIWNKLTGRFKRTRVGDLSLSSPAEEERDDKRDEKKLRKENEALRKKEREKEVAEKEWSTYTKAEKTRFIVLTILKVCI